MRRFLHSVLHDKISATYEPIQERESKALLLGLLSQPDDFQDLFMLFSSNVILQVRPHDPSLRMSSESFPRPPSIVVRIRYTTRTFKTLLLMSVHGCSVQTLAPIRSTTFPYWSAFGLPLERANEENLKRCRFSRLPSFMKPWQAHGKKLHDLEMRLYTSLASTVKRQMANNERPECIMRCPFMHHPLSLG